MERYFALLTPENQAYVKSVIAAKLQEQLQGPISAWSFSLSCLYISINSAIVDCSFTKNYRLRRYQCLDVQNADGGGPFPSS